MWHISGIRSAAPRYEPDYDSSSSSPPPPLPPASRTPKAAAASAAPHSSYTRDYIKNLPPSSSPSRRPPIPRDSSPSNGGRTSGYEHSSFSSQSSEKSDPPAFTALPSSRSHGALYRENSKWVIKALCTKHRRSFNYNIFFLDPEWFLPPQMVIWEGDQTPGIEWSIRELTGKIWDIQFHWFK